MLQSKKGDSNNKQSLYVLLNLVSLSGILHQSLAVLLSVFLFPESVTATPKPFSPPFTSPEQNYVVQGKKQTIKDKIPFPFSLSLFSSNDATRAAAERAYKEGLQLYKQGTAESKRQAIAKLEEALPLYRAVSDKTGEAVTLLGIGTVYDDLGEKQKALEYYNQSLPLSQAAGNKAGVAVILNNIGLVYDDLGEKQKALEFYHQSLPLSRAAGDKVQEAITLNNIGAVYDVLGEKQRALEFYHQSLPRRATGDKAGRARTLNNIGQVYDTLGEKQKALEFYNQSLSMFRATGNKAEEAVTLNNIGAVYDVLGEKQKALEFYHQSLSLKRMTGDKAQEAVTLNNIGAVYNALGEKQKALEFYHQSLLLSRAAGDKTQAAITLNNIGQVYSSLGEKQKALEFYHQSLLLSRAAENKAGEALTLWNLAYLESTQGNINVALTQMEAAINIIEDLRTKIGSQELRTSYFASVQDYYLFYIDLLMQLHKTNPNKGYDAQALHASERSRARSLLELLTEANADIRQGADPKLLEQERTLQQKLDALEKRRIELLNEPDTNAQLQALEQERTTLQKEYQQLQEQIRRTSPRYASLKYPQPLTLSEIQQQVLDENTLLLEYSLGSERSYLWAVTKTSLTSYELPNREDIEALAQSFYEQTGNQKAPEQRGIGAVPREDSLDVTTKLSQILLSPVAGQLAGKRLLIVSDGALQYLPFAALPAPDSLGKDETPVPLIVKHEIVNSPSASTIAIIRQNTNGRSVAPKKVAVIADPVFSLDDERIKSLVGQASRLLPGEGGQDAHPTSQREGGQDTHPTSLDSELSVLALTRSQRDVGITFQRLPFTRQEGSRILSLVPKSQSYSAFDFAANRATALSPQLNQYQIVHFATHGILNSKNPELSGVVLSMFDQQGQPANGFLRLNDIFNLNLPAELVVLSACETGLGKDVKGEGLVGLTRGFMYAGAKRVVVSLWSVNDTATASLMTQYYQQMLDKGLNPVAALRAAQLEMLKTENWQAPYYWAAFTVQGEWR